MRKSIPALIAAAVLPLAAAPPAPAVSAEWRGVRRQLEKQGVKVDHFAKTPADLGREQANIRRQLERANDPARGKSMRSIGGAAAVTPRLQPGLRKPSRQAFCDKE